MGCKKLIVHWSYDLFPVGLRLGPGMLVPEDKPESIQMTMIKKPLYPQRIRKIASSFAFIEHRFLRDGFWSTLDQHQLLLYVFLILVADRNGQSYYSYDKICTLLKIVVEDYIVARDALIEKDLIGFDGHLFQVLSLPVEPIDPGCTVLKSKKDMQKHDPATIHQLIGHCLGKKHG